MSGKPRRRKAIPQKLRAEIALRQHGRCICGCDEKLLPGFHIDHDPPLKLREWDEVARDTIPPANDPYHLFAMIPGHHRRKTSHPRGPHTSIDSDQHAIAKVRRICGGNKPKPKRKWAKRKMAARPPSNVKQLRGL